MIDEFDFLNELISKLNENKEKSVYAVIYNSETIDENYIILEEFIPFLSINSFLMNHLVKYDINREGIIYFIQISCK